MPASSLVPWNNSSSETAFAWSALTTSASNIWPMKSSTLIVSYLWKDTWKRWREQPGSPMARLFVTILLVAVATAILVSFQLMERGLQERLDRFTLDTPLYLPHVPPIATAISAQAGNSSP